MEDREKEELALLRKIEKNLREAKDVLLMDRVPNNCNCQNQAKMKQVFRCPQSFNINMCLEALTKLK